MRLLSALASMGSRISVWIQSESIKFPIADLQPGFKVVKLKKEIFHHTGIYINNQILRYKDQVMEDGLTLGECGVTAFAIIWVEERKEDSQKLFIESAFGTRLLTLDFNPEDTILKIKEHFLRNLNIPIERQKLFFTSVLLTDAARLSAYKIQEGTSLRLEVSQRNPNCIMVEMPEGKVLDLEYNMDQTVEGLKDMITSATGIDTEEQRLFFKEEHLEDKKSLFQYNFKVADTIKLKLRVKGHIILYIEATTTKQTLFDFPLEKTIYDIKVKIMEESNVLTDRQLLYFEGSEVTNESTLRECGIGDGSKIKLVVRGLVLMNIFVVLNTKRRLPFEVDPKSSVLELKTKLEADLQVPVNRQRLVFSGKLLEDGKRLSDYNIQKENAIHLVQQFSAGEIQIVVKTHNDNEYPISVLPTTTILEIKDKVSRNEYGPHDQYQLTFSGLQLEEERTVADYEIKNESSLCMVLKRDEENPQVPIRVRTLSQLVTANRGRPSTLEIDFESENIFQPLSGNESCPLDPIDGPYSVEANPPNVDPHEIINSELYQPSANPTELSTGNPSFTVTSLTRPRSISFRANNTGSPSSESPPPPEYNPDAIGIGQLIPLASGAREEVHEDAIPIANISLNVSVLCSGELTIEVRDTATIRDVKRELLSQRGLNIENQKIYFKDLLCEDIKTLTDLAIVNNSNIQVDVLHCWTVCFVRHVFNITSYANSKIIYLKQCINDKERIAIEDQQLSHDGRELSNEQSLLHYFINPDTKITLELHKSVSIQFSTGKKFILNSCHMKLTGGQIKQQIQDKFQIPFEYQTLVYCGKEFKDKLTLEAIKYRTGGLIILNVDSERSELLTLFVQMSTGDQQIVKIHCLDTVGKIKSLLFADNFLLIDHHDFNYNTRILSDDNILESYQIPNRSDIQMTLNIFTVINVTLLSGSVHPFCLQRFQTIEVVKRQMQDQFGLQYTHSKLYLNKNVILGNINQQYISNGDNLFLGLENSFLVDILPNKSRHFEILLTPDERVVSVKRKIETKVHIPIHAQILKLDGRLMSNDEIIGKLNICEFDVITLQTQDLAENLITITIIDEPAGNRVELNNIDRYRTVYVVFESLEFKGFPAKDDDSFVVNGSVLRDNVPLCSYGIRDGSKLLLISKSIRNRFSSSNFVRSKEAPFNIQHPIHPIDGHTKILSRIESNPIQSHCLHCQQFECVCLPRGKAYTMPREQSPYLVGHMDQSEHVRDRTRHASYHESPSTYQHGYLSYSINHASTTSLTPANSPARDFSNCCYQLRPEYCAPPNQPYLNQQQQQQQQQQQHGIMPLQPSNGQAFNF